MEAPPDTFGWNLAPSSANVEKTLAVPTKFEIGKKNVAYKYNAEASEVIWLSASPYRGDP